MTAAVQNEVDTTIKTFWVRNFPTKINATLRATGTHSNIWVAEDNYSEANPSDYNDNKITSAQAQAMADKFDLIYGKETALFGFECGGEPSGDGGVDGDSKIQILVHDIDGNYTPGQSSGTFGYFYNADEFSQEYWNTYNDFYDADIKSNEMEIFYMDAYFTDMLPDACYSTLIHEFQHMIHFNRKSLTLELNNSGTWYNEMLSMLAEDVIDPLIDINVGDDGHPTSDRIPRFLGNYNQVGVAVWREDTVNVLSYFYANSYAFGAYLVRNFGGAKLIQELMLNSSIDEASVTAALASTANPLRSEVDTFDKALRRYGEALVFSQPADTRPSGVLSFNNTVSDTINSNNYTFTGFDIWKIQNVLNGTKGPYVFDTEQRLMNGRTMLLQSKTAWQSVSGDLSITVQKPTSSDIEVYVMVR
jgi:hypothetical protein